MARQHPVSLYGLALHSLGVASPPHAVLPHAAVRELIARGDLRSVQVGKREVLTAMGVAQFRSDLETAT